MSGLGTGRCAFSGCDNPCPRDEDYCCSGCEEAGGDEDAAVGALIGLGATDWQEYYRQASADLVVTESQLSEERDEADALRDLVLSGTTSRSRRARRDRRRHRFMVALVAVEATALAVIALHLAVPL